MDPTRRETPALAGWGLTLPTPSRLPFTFSQAHLETSIMEGNAHTGLQDSTGRTNLPWGDFASSYRGNHWGLEMSVTNRNFFKKVPV